jgi:hypothetical protein
MKNRSVTLWSHSSSNITTWSMLSLACSDRRSPIDEASALAADTVRANSKPIGSGSGSCPSLAGAWKSSSSSSSTEVSMHWYATLCTARHIELASSETRKWVTHLLSA